MDKSLPFENLPEYVKEYFMSQKKQMEKERIDSKVDKVLEVLDGTPIDECLKVLGEVRRILRRE
ncbi:MAG: hypothetical protein ACOYBL_13900 [Lachnospiraceae bacterium]